MDPLLQYWIERETALQQQLCTRLIDFAQQQQAGGLYPQIYACWKAGQEQHKADLERLQYTAGLLAAGRHAEAIPLYRLPGGTHPRTIRLMLLTDFAPQQRLIALLNQIQRPILTAIQNYSTLYPAAAGDLDQLVDLIATYPHPTPQAEGSGGSSIFSAILPAAAGLIGFFAGKATGQKTQTEG